MSPANADVFSSFPNLTIYPIIELPTYETINLIHLRLNQNSASVDSNLEDGQNCLLPLTVSVSVYNTLSTAAFFAPTNPGPHTMETGTTIQIVADARVRTENTRMWREYQETDKALKQLFLSAVIDIYTSAMKHHVTGYTDVTTWQLIIHLYGKYGNIIVGALEDNERKKNSIRSQSSDQSAVHGTYQSIDFTNIDATQFTHS